MTMMAIRTMMTMALMTIRTRMTMAMTLVLPGGLAGFLHDHVQLTVVEHGFEDRLQAYGTHERGYVRRHFASEGQTEILGRWK